MVQTPRRGRHGWDHCDTETAESRAFQLARACNPLAIETLPPNSDTAADDSRCKFAQILGAELNDDVGMGQSILHGAVHDSAIAHAALAVALGLPHHL